jgi:hypothetical protein
MVEGRRPHAVNPPLLLAHRDHAPPCGFGGREMNVAQLRQGVADRVVDRAFADLAALDVRDGDSQRNRHGGRRQQLVAVGDEEQQVGPQAAQHVGQADGRHADGFRGADVGIGAQQALHTFVHGEAVAFDLGHRGPELRGEVGRRRHDLELDLRPRGKLLQRPVEMAVVGARGGHHGDASAHVPAIVAPRVDSGGRRTDALASCPTTRKP